MKTYRRRKQRDAWHWCKNCSNWPTSDFEEKTSKPKSGEQCNECRSKTKRNRCRA